jgi:predicted cupin superfamily sugar epimerase
MQKDADYWIRVLQLNRHIEGGSFREVYRSNLELPREILPPDFKGPCVASTSIYFLLEKNQYSAFHRICSDEVWHFYAGHSLRIYEIEASGNLLIHKLGNNPEQGETFQCIIKAGNWFAAKVADGGDFTLAGCTVSPGFDFRDFELADGALLAAEFPQHQEWIAALSQKNK